MTTTAPRSLIAEHALAAGRKVVTAAAPNAAAAGIATYGQGGNAFDAALAACFVETIALPMKCGLAGDVVALFRVAGGPLQALISIGPGPSGLAHGHTLERTGPRSVGIPGAPDGYAFIARLAAMPLGDLVKPAIAAAEQGVVWTRVALGYVHEAEALLRKWNRACPYLPDGRIPAEGDLLRLPALADLLRDFAVQGAALFDGTAHGRAIVDHLAQLGGFLVEDDFRVRPARVAEPVRLSLGEHDTLFATPAPTHGARLLQAIDAHRAQGVPLVDAVLAARRNGRKHAPADTGTSVVTAADDQGNAIVVVHSNSFPRFGSGVVLPSGLVLNNRPGRGFSLDARPGEPNAPAAGVVPQTTLHAWALQRADALLMGATPGGINQMPWNAQVVTALLDGASVEQAVCAPHWALDDADELIAEDDADPHGALPVSKRVPALGFRSVEQVLRLSADATAPHHATADPRAGARALGLY